MPDPDPARPDALQATPERMDAPQWFTDLADYLEAEARCARDCALDARRSAYHGRPFDFDGVARALLDLLAGNLQDKRARLQDAPRTPDRFALEIADRVAGEILDAIERPHALQA